MPQEFQILRCFKCNIFQVHQVKKVKKWECKMCGEKQSLKKTFGVGTGKECRLHVQKLNTLQAENREQDIDNISKPQESQNNFSSGPASEIGEIASEISTETLSGNHSKWTKFIESKSDVETEIYPFNEAIEEHDTLFGNVEIVLEISKRRPNMKALAKPSLTQKRNRAMEDGINFNHNGSTEIKMSPKNFSELSRKRCEETPRSSLLPDIRFGNKQYEDISHKSSTEQFVHNINDRCAKSMKLESKTLPENSYVGKESLTDNIFSEHFGEEIVVAKKNSFVVPTISSNSKWFKFLNENENKQISNNGACNLNSMEYDLSNLKHDLNDGKNDAENMNHILEAPNYGSKQTDSKMMMSYKIRDIKPNKIFSIADDEDLDDLLEF